MKLENKKLERAVISRIGRRRDFEHGFICAKPKNRMRNSVSFLLKCKKRGTLMEPNFSGTFFGQKHGKNSDASKHK